jgi:hypothetical protein
MIPPWDVLNQVLTLFRLLARDGEELRADWEVRITRNGSIHSQRQSPLQIEPYI